MSSLPDLPEETRPYFYGYNTTVLRYLYFNLTTQIFVAPALCKIIKVSALVVIYSGLCTCTLSQSDHAFYTHDVETFFQECKALFGLFIELSDLCFSHQDGSTALMFACQNGHIETVKKLLAVPSCDVNLKDNVSCHLLTTRGCLITGSVNEPVACKS